MVPKIFFTLEIYSPHVNEKNNFNQKAEIIFLPDTTPPIGKIYPFRRIGVTFEPIIGF